MPTCPKGHISSDPDYCSECGMKMESNAVVGTSAVAQTASTATGEICPDCATPRVPGSRFCEVCRFDFSPQSGGTQTGKTSGLIASASTRSKESTGSPGASSHSLPPIAVTNVGSATASKVASTPVSKQVSALAPRLNVIVITDPSLVTDPQPEKPCPVGVPDRTFPLDLAENLVGRRQERKGIFPEVEVSDPGVSHRHLKLIRQDDGGFMALDLGSANGTQVNGTAMTPGVAVRVNAGDEILIGLWTRLAIRVRD